MRVLVLELPPWVCARCGTRWDRTTDRCSSWWCDESERLHGQGAPSSVHAGSPEQRKLPEPEYFER